MMRWMTFLMMASAAGALAQEAPFRLAIAGLEHGHAEGFFRALKNRSDVKLVGVAERDETVRQKYAARHGLAPEILFSSVAEMLDKTKPEAVASFGPTFDHAEVVEVAAARHVPVMMEKPLAVSLEHARRIQKAAADGHVPVIVNYETTWYKSHGEIRKLVNDRESFGPIRKMVAMDGHQGPREIGVPPEFFAWLTDPERNGAGALFDFGCYGANLMTWLMEGVRPVAVTAMTHRFKPQIYPRVDDDAVVLVDYPGAQGIIQASWNWPFNRKDLEVYGTRSYAVATGGDGLRVRVPNGKEESRIPALLPELERDSVTYLKAVARGQIQPGGLSSLENNVIVTEILDAARESARTGRRVELAGRK